MKPTNDCSCQSCVANCERVPGWMLPDEVAPMAKLLKLSEQELFDRYLVVDLLYGPSEATPHNIFLLRPATDTAPAGRMAPFNPRGRCVFLDENNRCQVHEAKPFECAMSHHDSERTASDHHDIGRAWDNAESRAIAERLNGSEPVMPEPTIFDALSFLSEI